MFRVTPSARYFFPSWQPAFLKQSVNSFPLLYVQWAFQTYKQIPINASAIVTFMHPVSLPLQNILTALNPDLQWWLYQVLFPRLLMQHGAAGGVPMAPEHGLMDTCGRHGSTLPPLCWALLQSSLDPGSGGTCHSPFRSHPPSALDVLFLREALVSICGQCSDCGLSMSHC